MSDIGSICARFAGSPERPAADCAPQTSPRPAPPVLTRQPVASPSPPLIRHTKQVVRTYGRPVPGAGQPRQPTPSRAQLLLQAAAGRGAGLQRPASAAQPPAQPGHHQPRYHRPVQQPGAPARRPVQQPTRPSHIEQQQAYVMSVPAGDQQTTPVLTVQTAQQQRPAPQQQVQLSVQLGGAAHQHHQYTVVSQPAAAASRVNAPNQYGAVTIHRAAPEQQQHHQQQQHHPQQQQQQQQQQPQQQQQADGTLLLVDGAPRTSVPGGAAYGEAAGSGAPQAQERLYMVKPVNRQSVAVEIPLQR